MIKIGSFLIELLKKIKMWAFFGTQCINCVAVLMAKQIEFIGILVYIYV